MPTRQNADASKASPDSYDQAYTQSNEGKDPNELKVYSMDITDSNLTLGTT